MSGGSALSVQFIHSRISLVALVAVAAIAWVFLLACEAAMTSMRGEGALMDLMWSMMAPQVWPVYLAAATLMWVVMMIAMMIPAVLPMAMVYRGLYRATQPNLDTALFASGYLAGWVVFSLVAAGLQWWLHLSGYLHGHLLDASPRMAAAILVFTGLYQLTPFKEACLSRCRSPVSFFMQHWTDGHRGAVAMGLRHGLYCIGCCWMLMLVMFVGGAMSVVTMGALSAFILAERVLPAGPWVSRLPGTILVGAGALLFFRN